jgi:hypothetical protein
MNGLVSRFGRSMTAVSLFLAATVSVLGSVGGGTASAALPPVSGCGFHFGPVTEQGAAGTLFFAVTLEPASPAQRCTTLVGFTAALRATGAPYTNVDNNPLISSEPATFTPGRLPPQLVVGWGRFHCADPAGPGTLTITSAGQQIGIPVAAMTCGGPGSSNSVLLAASVPPISVVGLAPTVDNKGYLITDQLADVKGLGDGKSLFPAFQPSAPIVGIQATRSGTGAWLVAADGGVFTSGNATFHGSLGNVHLNAPIVGMASTPDGLGYWLVAADGGVFTFGDAKFHGSLGNVHLNAPIVGMAPTPDGLGYWLVAADGGVFTFGDAAFDGSLGNVVLDAPIVATAAGPHGGYWLVASDGGVFTFGGVPFEGSLGAIHLDAPISAMAATSTGTGYWLLGADGGVFTFGNAGFFGTFYAP